MQSVGQILREERLRRGLALEEISDRTRISVKNLTAIENDDLAHISSTFFYKSFVRQFADVLSVDQDRLAPIMGASLGRVSPKQIPLVQSVRQPLLSRNYIPQVASMGRPSRSGAPSLMSLVLLVVALVVCSGLYAAWKRSGKAAEETAQLSELRVQAHSSSEASSDRELQEQKYDAKASEARASTGTGERFVVRVAAFERTWLSIVTDGRRIFSGNLDPSQTKILEGHDSAQLKTENAGGLTVTFNGRTIGPIGPHGEVRTVVFTPGAFEIVRPRTAANLQHFAFLSGSVLFSPTVRP